MIPVDKDIPIPARSRRGRPRLYPWDTMEIGDSFFVARKIHGFGPMAYKAARTYGRRFTVRKVEGGVRVWRTA